MTIALSNRMRVREENLRSYRYILRRNKEPVLAHHWKRCCPPVAVVVVMTIMWGVSWGMSFCCGFAGDLWAHVILF